MKISVSFFLQNRCNDISQIDAQENNTKLNENAAQNNSKTNDFQQNDTLLKGTFYKTAFKLWLSDIIFLYAMCHSTMCYYT